MRAHCCRFISCCCSSGATVRRRWPVAVRCRAEANDRMRLRMAKRGPSAFVEQPGCWFSRKESKQNTQASHRGPTTQRTDLTLSLPFLIWPLAVVALRCYIKNKLFFFFAHLRLLLFSLLFKTHTLTHAHGCTGARVCERTRLVFLTFLRSWHGSMACNASNTYCQTLPHQTLNPLSFNCHFLRRHPPS